MIKFSSLSVAFLIFCCQTTFAQILLYPQNHSVLTNNSVVLSWDGKDVKGNSKIYVVLIKAFKAGENPDTAISENPLVSKIVTGDTYQFDYSTIKSDKPITFIWQVKTYFQGDNAAKDRLISKSAVRTFSIFNEQRRDWLIEDGNPTKLDDNLALVNHDCRNGGAEYGNFTGWAGYYGSRSNSAGIHLNALTSGILPGKLSIITAATGNDPILAQAGISLPMVDEGDYSIRIGNKETLSEADLIKYTFVVTDNNKSFTFRYAAVFQDYGHNPDQQPFLSYYVVKGPNIYVGSSSPIIDSRQIVAKSDNPFFKTADVSNYGQITYRKWTPVCIDLSAYVGQTVTAVFFTADCSEGGHFGYAYIDGLCENNEPNPQFSIPDMICGNEDLIANASATTNEITHFWSIEVSDANWGRNPATEVNRWFVAEEAGIKNLTELYASFGKKFLCNTYYRIGLAVANDCVSWRATTRLVYIDCPSASAGSDKCVSCTLPTAPLIQLGQTGISAQTYVWSPASGLSNPNVAQPYYTGIPATTLPKTYTVTVTDSKGCKTSDEVTLYCRKPTLVLSQNKYCCGVSLHAEAQEYTTIKWSTGETGESIDVQNPGVYTAVATNACGSITQNITVSNYSILRGYPNTIAYPSQFNPSVRNFNIYDVMTNNGIEGTPNSYNATDYKLQIFDRWGSMIREILPPNGPSCTGFNNWDIYWDGRDRGGQIVPSGAYSWKLYLKNCQYKEWVTPNERKFSELVCLKYLYILGRKTSICLRKGPAGPDTYDTLIEAGSVVVFQ